MPSPLSTFIEVCLVYQGAFMPKLCQPRYHHKAMQREFRGSELRGSHKALSSMCWRPALSLPIILPCRHPHVFVCRPPLSTLVKVCPSTRDFHVEAASTILPCHGLKAMQSIQGLRAQGLPQSRLGDTSKLHASLSRLTSIVVQLFESAARRSSTVMRARACRISRQHVRHMSLRKSRR